jgi:glycosyltransferase involved in cell wall biosynthesis
MLHPVAYKARIKRWRCLLEVRILRAVGIPVIWTIHNLASHESLDVKSETRSLGRLARSVSALIVHCVAARSLVEEAYGVRELAAKGRGAKRVAIYVVPHGSYSDYYSQETPREVTRAGLGLTEENLALLCFGALRQYKGIVEFAHAFTEVARRHHRLVICGQPGREVARSLETLAAEDPRVRLNFGYVSAPRLADLLNAADAVVLPYRDVLTSGAAMLAMDFGRAIVARPVGCLPEILEPSGTVWLRSCDASEVAGALRRLAERGPARLGQANAAHAKKFRWSALAPHIAQIYRAELGK